MGWQSEYNFADAYSCTVKTGRHLDNCKAETKMPPLQYVLKCRASLKSIREVGIE